MAERIVAMKVGRDKFFIDDGDGRGIRSILFFNSAAKNHRNTKSFEVSGANLVPEEFDGLIVRRISLDNTTRSAGSCSDWWSQRKRRGLDAGKIHDSAAQLFVV